MATKPALKKTLAASTNGQFGIPAFSHYFGASHQGFISFQRN
jgi:hypothetical protein